MMQSTTADLYMNMSQFSELKLSARQDSAAASKKVAQQFEGLFVQMMLKNMRSAAIMDPSQHSSNMDFYTDMYDKQMSLMLSQQGGIGIADLLVSQLARFTPPRQESAALEGKELPVYNLPLRVGTHLPMPEMNYVAANPAVKAHPLEALSGIQTTGIQARAASPFYGWGNAGEFVGDLWPHAEIAAEKLGVSPRVLVAQSALETGWGQHGAKKADGSSAFTLFGIKSGHDWSGQSVSRQTLEFREGTMQRETARFRAYDSVPEALHDYVNFVQSSPRYQSALQHHGSDSQYIRKLQAAGYATDPAYANKVIAIMSGQTFIDASGGLQTSPARGFGLGENHG